jgi:diguanylate cyclase (GGDEF)-like protein/PAS domain S-box-containing protein
MTIRQKIFTVIGLTLIILLISLQIVSSVVLHTGFARIEEQEAQENTSRVEAALEDVATKINSTAGDWAWWDDTYRYAIDKNSTYERANLGVNSISNLRVNHMILMSSDGRIIFGTGFDLNKNVRTPLSVDLVRELTNKNNPLLQHPHLEDSKQGVLFLPQGPILIASRAILKSNRRGPSHGTLILGRNLDINEIKNLSVLTHFPIELEPFSSALNKNSVPNNNAIVDFNRARETLTPTNRTLTYPVNDNKLWGYALIDDVYKKPALILRVSMPRRVHVQEQQTMQYMLVSLFVACVLFCGVIFWLLQEVILVPLESLTGNVRHIALNNDLTYRLREVSRDELGTLAMGINELLQTIEQSQQSLQESETRFRTFMDNSPAVAFIKDSEGRMIYVNSTFEECFEKKRADVIGKTDFEIWPVEIAQNLREHDLTVIRTGKAVQVEETVLISDDKTTDWLTFRFPLRGQNGQLSVAGMGVDITLRKRMEAQLTKEQESLAIANSQLADLNKQLEQQAMRDELTQLANRRAFNQKLQIEMERSIRNNTPLSLLLLDIDKFKDLNDNWGHAYGDEALKQVAELLQTTLRAEDFSARYGGEEMAVILPNTTAEVALSIAERCRHSIEEGKWPHGIVTASFGVSTFRQGMEATAFVVAADAALYMSKKNGRNRSTHASQISSINQ